MRDSIKKYGLIIFLPLMLVIAGCSSKSSSGLNQEGIDTDGDGILNEYDPDIDGDGIPNQLDPDIDGDGIPNGSDNDDDGDGIPDKDDQTASGGDSTGKNFCTSAKIIPPSDELVSGTIAYVSWNLEPKDCLVNQSGKGKAIASPPAARVDVVSTVSVAVSPGAGGVAIQIPKTCVGTSLLVTYDISQIGLALGDPNAGGFNYKQDVNHPVRCKGNEIPENQPVACPDGSYTWPSCSCPDGKGYDVSTNSCLDISGGIGSGSCPSDASGTYPICFCPDGKGYDVSGNSCLDISDGIGSCPSDATGSYPDCSCPTGLIYQESSNSCIDDSTSGGGSPGGGTTGGADTGGTGSPGPDLGTTGGTTGTTGGGTTGGGTTQCVDKKGTVTKEDKDKDNAKQRATFSWQAQNHPNKPYPKCAGDCVTEMTKCEVRQNSFSDYYETGLGNCSGVQVPKWDEETKQCK